MVANLTMQKDARLAAQLYAAQHPGRCLPARSSLIRIFNKFASSGTVGAGEEGKTLSLAMTLRLTFSRIWEPSLKQARVMLRGLLRQQLRPCGECWSSLRCIRFTLACTKSYTTGTSSGEWTCAIGNRSNCTGILDSCKIIL